MQEDIDARVQAYYASEFDEQRRLERPAGRLEMARVRELVAPLLAPHSTIVDIGGGTGVHAQWLAEAGHHVTVVDPVARHVEIAAQIPGVEATIGDARSLMLESNSCDAALLFGPLYHLESRASRVQALREAARVVRPGGTVFGAVIPRWAVYTDSTTTLPDGASVPDEIHRILDTGESHPQAHFPGAHFHTSTELAAEMQEADLEVIELAAIEGPGGLPLEFVAQADDATIDAALTLVRAIGHLEGPREMSPHLMGIGRRR